MGKKVDGKANIARELGVSPSTISRLNRLGELPSELRVDEKRKIVIRVYDVDGCKKYLQRNGGKNE